MSSWLAGILAGALGRLLTGLVDWLLEKIKNYSAGSNYVDETKKKIETLKSLQNKAKDEVNQTGEVSANTREAIRMAGRELIRK